MKKQDFENTNILNHVTHCPHNPMNYASISDKKHLVQSSPVLHTMICICEVISKQINGGSTGYTAIKLGIDQFGVLLKSGRL